MLNFLPAVLVGGPPHTGKSVLFYRLTQALRERGVEHYALRACPDGEGNWYQESDPTLVGTLVIKHKTWPASFIERIGQDLEHRCLPFLVDMGGHPSAAEMVLFRSCTHAILLYHEDSPEKTQRWQELIEAANLLPLARLSSRREGTTTLTSSSPLLEGVLTGLERHSMHAESSELFNALVDRLATLFTSYDLQDQTAVFLAHAPTELTINLPQALQIFTQTSVKWEPAMLQPFLDSLPTATPLSVYGSGPSWLYSALASLSDPHPIYLFDPRFGWIQPLSVTCGKRPEQTNEITTTTEEKPGYTILKLHFPQDRLEYFQPEPLAFPSIPREQGVIIDGKVPNWLLTALVRLYKAADIAWFATFYPQLEKAVVVYSRQQSPQPGDLV